MPLLEVTEETFLNRKAICTKLAFAYRGYR